MWGNGYDDSFWGYGYDDIYAGLFAPYAYDDLTGYLPEYASAPQGTSGAAPPASATPNPEASQLTQMCGQDSHDIAGLPIDQFQQAIKPTEAQQAALDELANASLKAAQDIKAACPADIARPRPQPNWKRTQQPIDKGGDDIRGGSHGEARRWINRRPPERRAEGAADRTR